MIFWNRRNETKLSIKSRVFRILLAALLVLVLLAAGLAAFWTLSPLPAVWLIRHPMSEGAALTYPADYPARQERVEILKDQTYPSADGRNRYDLYLPKDPAGEVPVVVWVHGGAFVAGSKDGVENWGVMLASEGYAVAAVEYQLAPEIPYPGQVRQVGECIAALQARADLPLDMTRVYLAGDSAGAHIAAQCGLAVTNPAFAEETGLTPALAPEALRGMLLCCGPYDVGAFLTQGDPAVQFFVGRIGWAMLGRRDWQQSPLLPTLTVPDYVTEAFPPTFLTDGNTGSFESQGRALAETLRAQGVDVSTLFFGAEAGAVGHEYQYDLASPEGWACWEAALAFLAAHP